MNTCDSEVHLSHYQDGFAAGERNEAARADAAEAKLREIREVLAAGGWGNDPDAKEYVPMATQLDRINEIVEREGGAE